MDAKNIRLKVLAWCDIATALILGLAWDMLYWPAWVKWLIMAGSVSRLIIFLVTNRSYYAHKGGAR